MRLFAPVAAWAALCALVACAEPKAAAAGADAAVAETAADAAKAAADSGAETVAAETAGSGDADAATQPDAAADSVADSAAPAEKPLQPLSALDEGKVYKMAPGGQTTCALGGEFAFFVRKGKANKVVVDFQGGGACWNAATCAIGDAICTQTIDMFEAAALGGYAKGIYDAKNPKNPFSDWTYVMVPYCSCDIHWGDADATYGEGKAAFTVHHRGAVNVGAVLKWLYANVAKPERVFVTGCSAGSYGSLLWSAHLMHHYEGTPVVQMGDSGAGIITASFLADSFPQWNAVKQLPNWVPAFDPKVFDLKNTTLGDLYHQLGAANPTQRLSQYNTAYDENQTFYFKAMGGSDEVEWNKQMTASIGKIVANTPNFRHFTMDGEKHCILPFDEFYSYEVGGTKFVDWMTDLALGKDVQNVTCGANCKKKL